MTAAVAALAVSCVDTLSILEAEKQEMAQRQAGQKDLEVTYGIEGEAPATVFTFDNRPREVEISVGVNDDNLRWNVESNRDWCKVEAADHRGPGMLKLRIEANESFGDRNPATLTFSAGAFRGFTFTVNQKAGAFLVSQPYFLAGKDTRSGSVVVSVAKEGGSAPQWTAAAPEWISVSKGSVVSEDADSQAVRLDWTLQENAGDSRSGNIILKMEGSRADAEVSFYQFGHDFQWDSEGNLFFPPGSASLSFSAPRFFVDNISVPDYASVRSEDNGDITVFTIELQENYSDCAELRLTDISLTLANLSASVVKLPGISQDFVSAHGLVTAKGLSRFAAAIASGESTADWEDNGVVILKGDIDMTGVDAWTGIGTAAKPFTGQFDGKGYSINNLKKAGSGIFGVCQGAVIRNLNLGETSNIYMNSGAVAGGIVNVAKSTTIQGCSQYGAVELSGKDASLTSVGGIAGSVDAKSSVVGCKSYGSVALSSPSGSYTADCGGIAGYSEGDVNNCEQSGTVLLNSTVSDVNAGGILGLAAPAAKMSGNSFFGTLELKGGATTLNAGGLYGKLQESDRTFDSATDMSVIMGTINVTSFASSTSTKVFAGGLAGLLEEGSKLTVKGYEIATNFLVNQEIAMTSAYLCTGGILGGCESDGAAAKVVFENIANHGNHRVAFLTTVTSPCSNFCMGGLAGYVNGPLEVRSCFNDGVIGDGTNAGAYCSKSNAYRMMVAGMVAQAEGGNASFSQCNNAGMIQNAHYCNNHYTNYNSGRVICNAASGILGVFEYKQNPASYTLKMDSCTNTGTIQAYRGICSGIVGYGSSATISKCVNKGNMAGSKMSGVCALDNLSAYTSGIASILRKSTVSDCQAVTSIYASSPGSEPVQIGGILSVDLGSTTITDCSYFGIQTILAISNTSGTGNYGGIVGLGSDGTVVKGCKFGGTLYGTTITENNFDLFVIGNRTGKVENISYWDGK